MSSKNEQPIAAPRVCVSPHLTLAEVACRNGVAYPRAWIETRLLPLADEFEAIRRECGRRPIRVLSAYRTAEYNASVGGSRYSQHIEGRALDLAPPAGVGLPEFWQIANRVSRERRVIRGLGLYPWGVHIDTRPGPRLVKWSGTRALAELVEVA